MTRDEVYLRHILDACARIGQYTSVGRERFMSEEHWQDATIRQLEIVGEAAKRLSWSLRNRHPQVPWRRMTGLRDVLIHDYMGVDLAAVWVIADKDVPALERQLRRMLADDSPEGE